MPAYAYERVKLSNNQHRLVRQRASSFNIGCKKSFVQLYTVNEGYLDADPKKKLLKPSYIEEETLGLYNVEPCRLVIQRTGKCYFSRGKSGGEGTTRYYKPGFSVPALLKPSLRDFSYAVAKGGVPRDIEMNLIHNIDRLELEGDYIPDLIKGAVFYVDRYVIPARNVYRTSTLIDDLSTALESLVPYTRFGT